MIKAKLLEGFKFECNPGEFFISQHDGKKYPFMTLPCGHNFMPDDRWGMSDIEDETKISITPSIFCHGGTNGKEDCWHGYLTNGEFRSVDEL